MEKTIFGFSNTLLSVNIYQLCDRGICVRAACLFQTFEAAGEFRPAIPSSLCSMSF